MHLAAELPDLHGYIAKLRQLMMNLITNAADAIGDRPGDLFISTHTEDIDDTTFPGSVDMPALAAGRYIVITVRDTGCGMDATQLARIYEPFFTTKFTGRGLGLSAALGIVKGHGGAIAVDSQPGKGSQFRIALPPAPPEGNRPPHHKRPVTPVTTELGHARVLVVDDEPAVRWVLLEGLRHRGCLVEEAENGMKALKRLRQADPPIHLVLLDLTMPETDGEETIAYMTQEGLTTPVILMSGYSATETELRFTSPLIRGFIEKPFEMTYIYDTVQRVLAKP
jgi:CheY-like chemotaxis protein